MQFHFTILESERVLKQGKRESKKHILLPFWFKYNINNFFGEHILKFKDFQGPFSEFKDFQGLSRTVSKRPQTSWLSAEAETVGSSLVDSVEVEGVEVDGPHVVLGS